MDPDTDPRSDFERLGGEPALVALVDVFVDRMAADMIIGFTFHGKDLVRVKRHEVELNRLHLGGGGTYSGRGIGSLHRPLRINRGQFRRRIALLRQTLVRFQVPEDVVARWVAHDEKLIDLITDGTECVLDPTELLPRPVSS